MAMASRPWHGISYPMNHCITDSSNSN